MAKEVKRAPRVAERMREEIASVVGTELGDPRVRTLVDYENAKDVFPTVGIGGGICYFLWNRDESGACPHIRL